MNYRITRDDAYLEHHGILGQKWGIRRYQNKDGTWTNAGKKRYGDDIPDGKTSKKPKSASEMSTEELRKAVNRGNLERRYNELSTNSNSAGRVIDSAFNLSSALAGTSRDARIKQYEKEGMSKKQARKEANADLSALNTINNEGRATVKALQNVTHRKNKYKTNGKSVKELSDDELRKAIERMDLEQQYNRMNKKSVKRGLDATADALDTIKDLVIIGTAAAGAVRFIQKNGPELAYQAKFVLDHI